MAGGSCIRAWRASDIDSLVRHANNRAVWLNLRDRFPHPYTRADGEQWLEFVRTVQPGQHLAVDLDGEAVGGVAVEPGTDIERISGELGYWIGPEHWGKGLATRAAAEMTTHAFDVLGLHRVWASPFARNRASIRVLEKLGYRREGELVECIVKDGRIESMVLFAITAAEWREPPPAGR
jgi:[ribosomal protein S5]-alanine N-acetyltransferase